MEKIKNFSNSIEAETAVIKTDISHIYSKLNKIGSGGGNGSSGESEFERIKQIEEKINTLRFYEYKDLLTQKFTLVETLRYKAVDGFIELPPVMYFHYVTADETRPVSFVNNFKIDCVLSSDESESDSVTFNVVTNNNPEEVEYKQFSFDIKSTGTICSFEYQFTNTKFQTSNSASPFIISVKSNAHKKITCHILKLSVPIEELGNFSDKPIYLCHALSLENPVKSITAPNYPLALPYLSGLFVVSDKVGYVQNLKIKDFVQLSKLTPVEGLDIMETEIKTGNYDYSMDFSLPLTNAKDISFGKPGNWKNSGMGGYSRVLSFFYLSREGHVFYKIYDIIDDKLYEGQFCDGVFDGIGYFGDAGKTSGDRQECYLFLKPVSNITKMGNEDSEIIIYNFNKFFYKKLDKTCFKFRATFANLGLSGFTPCSFDKLNTKDEHPGFNMEVFNANYERKNIMVRLIFNETDNTASFLTAEFDGRAQLPGTGINYNRYMGCEIENNDRYYYMSTKNKLAELTDKRENVLIVPQKPGLTPIMQPIFRTHEFVCELDETTLKPSFRVYKRDNMPSYK